MENQVSYAERTRGLGATDAEIRADDIRRAVREADRAYENRKSEPQKSYANAAREAVQSATRKLSADRPATCRTAAPPSSALPQPPSKETSLSPEAAFFQKLEEAKNDQVTKYAYEGSSVADYMVLDKREYGYAEWFAKHTEEHGYAPYISKAMVMAYASEHDLKTKFFDDSTTHEYASMLLKLNSGDKKQNEPSLGAAEAVIKQSLCFKALQEACERKEITPEVVQTLHAKAAVLAEHIVKENIHVLDNKELLKEFLIVEKSGKNTHEHQGLLSQKNCSRIAELNRIDISMKQQSQMQKNKERGQIKIDRSYDLDMSR
jgi:hypothetical protein